MNRFIGKTIVSVDGLEKGGNELVFKFSDGNECKLHHVQDCCENVEIEEFDGDECLIGNEIFGAEETTKDGESEWGSETYTFYMIKTQKGTFHLRWIGSSNGYYSESVDITWKFEEARND